MLRDLVRHRDLLWLLTIREIRIRYARAFLGAGWALFLPLVMVATFTALSFDRLVPADSPFRAAGIPYSVYAFCGLVAWTHFSVSVTQATSSLVVARDILRKSAFPKAVIPLSRVAASLLDLGVGAAFLLALLAWKGIPLQPAALAVVPVLVLQVAFTAGVVLLTSAGNMFFRDVNYLVQVGVLLAMFATSVVYPVDPGAVHPRWAGAILAWNPMSSFLDSYRAAILLGEWPWDRLLPGAAGAVAAVLLGVGVFGAVEHRFAEEV